MKDCEPNPSLWPLSRCLDNYLDKAFGRCVIGNSSWETSAKICPRSEMFEVRLDLSNSFFLTDPLFKLIQRIGRMSFLKQLKWQTLTDKSGCRLPCVSHNFHLETIFEYNILNDNSIWVPEDSSRYQGENHTGVMIRMPTKRDTR